MERTIVGIDVGTTKDLHAGRRATSDTSLRIVGVGVVPSRGITKGVVVNVVEAAAGDRGLDRESRTHRAATRSSALSSAWPARTSRPSTAGAWWRQARRTRHQADDVDRALDAARAIAIPHDREVLHVIPRGYAVDGQDGVKDPLGMIGLPAGSGSAHHHRRGVVDSQPDASAWKMAAWASMTWCSIRWLRARRC